MSKQEPYDFVASAGPGTITDQRRKVSYEEAIKAKNEAAFRKESGLFEPSTTVDQYVQSLIEKHG